MIFALVGFPAGKGISVPRGGTVAEDLAMGPSRRGR